MTVRLIQVGFGGWGRGWLNNILQTDLDVKLVAGTDIDPEALQVLRERNIPSFQHLEEALATDEAEAVLVASTLPSHVSLVRSALEQKKHVLVEKPFAPSLEEARRLVDLAREQDRVLMVSQNYRHFPVPQAVADLVRGGSVGAVGVVNIDFRRPLNVERRNYDLWQPLLSNLSVHHFDLIRKVLGQEPVRIYCHAWNPPWSRYNDPASVSATIQFSGGTVVNYRGSSVSMGPTTPWAGEWHMECEGGELVWTSGSDLSSGNSCNDRLSIRLVGKEPTVAPLPALPYTNRLGCLNAFLRAIRDGQEPETSGRDNLQTLGLVMAAIASASSGRPEAV